MTRIMSEQTPTAKQYRKKPVIIEPQQWFPDRTVKGVHWEQRAGDDGEFLVPYVITIHEQRAYLAPGDWVMPEPTTGRFYPCKPDIFATTYEPVATPDPVIMAELEDEIAEAIDDSLDLDWTGAIGARTVVKLLRSKGVLSTGGANHG